VAVCEMLKIHKARTTPYRPSANGQVERYNRTLMDAVRCYIDKAQDRWDEHLAQIAGALRSAVNRSTGFTANKLMLGREVDTPAHLMYPPPPRAEEPDLDAYVADLQKSMLLAHETARSQLRTTEKRLKRDYDLKMRSHTYEVGDFVYFLDTATVKGKCRKLSPSWKGPGLIVQKLSDHLYRVRTCKSVMLTNHDRMQKCEDRDVPRWLLKARESQDADKTLEAADLNATSNADPSRGVTSQPESLAKDIPPENAASPSPTPGATAPPKRGRGRPRKTPRSAAPPRAEDPPVHCTCRRPDDGRLMIQCDRCDVPWPVCGRDGGRGSEIRRVCMSPLLICFYFYL
jgi:hypothetical protein